MQSSSCSQPGSVSQTGPAVVEVRLVGREVVGLGSVGQQVAHADGNLGEGREHVELGQRERGDAVDPDREAERRQVEPAAAALAARHGAELAAELAHALLRLALDLGRERALADAGHVGLRDAEDLVDAVRADAEADRRPGRDRARRGDERVRAVVEVEQRSLGALEEHVVAVAERAIDEERRVCHVRAQPLRIALVGVGDLLEVERLDLVHALEPDVLLRDRELDLLAQDLRVEQVLHADPDPRRLVGVRRADAAAGGADLEVAELPLARAVEGDVPRHDQVRVAGEEHEAGGDVAASLEVVELVDHHARVDDAAGADRATPCPATMPDGICADLVRLAVDDDCVPCVRPTLVAADEVGVLGEQVDDLALALVAPLRANDHGGRHVRHSCTSARRRASAVRRTVRAGASSCDAGRAFVSGRRAIPGPRLVRTSSGGTTAAQCGQYATASIGVPHGSWTNSRGAPFGVS